MHLGTQPFRSTKLSMKWTHSGAEQTKLILGSHFILYLPDVIRVCVQW